MAFSNYEFPYTRTYDGDLGFLIKEYQDLKAEYDNLLKDIEYVKEFADTLDVRVAKAIADAMDVFTVSVNKTLARYDDRINNAETSITEFQKILNSYASELYSMRKLILSLETELKVYSDINCDIVYQKCKMLIDEWSKTLPPVTDPTDGATENINDALQHMYDFMISGIQAIVLDGINITAKRFDDENITAKDFDTKGSNILGADNSIYMLSPFTGAIDTIVNVINSLASLHMSGISANSLDNLKLSGTNIDQQAITAYNFDWDNPLA